MSARPRYRQRYLAPRYWLAWLGLGAVKAMTWLPLSWTRQAGRGVGWLLARTLHERRHITAVNLGLCRPDLDEGARRRLVDAHFMAMGAAVFETAFAWFASDARIRRLGHVEGLAHLDAVQHDGQGVILLTGHFSWLELGARLLAVERGFHAMYRHVNNPLIDDWMYHARLRHTRRQPIPKRDIKLLIKSLRSGEAIWYAPDQTLGREAGLFLPMFGQPTWTITATARLATLGRARVVPFFTHFENGRYVVLVQPALDQFPSGDEAADAARVNRLIEAAAVRSPEAYFWGHKRFKKRPPDMPDPYLRAADARLPYSGPGAH
jgi:Kdo2-lipid IVA lauroyltransferase/acyltransferase